ncbi:MAG: TRAP transporter TatT component family protein [Spirochaetota bacterium]|nr:TRAP transporter TatT component family protein [Spirochaetota bacterium]
MLKRVIHLPVFALLLLSGCAGSHYIQKKALNMIGPAVPDLIDSMLKQRSGSVAKEGIAGNILLLAAMAEMTPDNKTYLVAVSMAYTSYAMLIEDENEEFSVELYTIAKEFGLRALMTDDDFKEAYEKGGIEATKEAIEDMGKDYVPALIWTALSWGMCMLKTMSKDAMAVQHLHNLEHMIKHAIEEDEKYFYGISHLFQMVIAAFMPPMMGGTPERVEEEFKKVMKISNFSLHLAYVYYVEFYAIPYELEDKFDEMLEIVINTPTSKYPNIALLNEISKMKARRLLNNKSEFFYWVD